MIYEERKMSSIHAILHARQISKLLDQKELIEEKAKKMVFVEKKEVRKSQPEIKDDPLTSFDFSQPTLNFNQGKHQRSTSELVDKDLSRAMLALH